MQRYALIGWFLLGSAGAAAAQQLPYKAYVTSDDVYVRSGPGDDYYPTDKLKAGQEVEVYRHDPGGWYAIRPPEGSFTWVATRYLDRQGDNIATVNSERVAARVGSRFSDIRDVIQVRLQRGESVEVLQNDPRDVQGEKGWCKIAPPSGEFRWIFGKYVDPEFPRDGVQRHHHHVTPTSATADPGVPGLRAGPPRPGAERREAEHRAERAAHERMEARAERTLARERDDFPPPRFHPDERPDAEPLSSATPAPMRRLGAEEFSRELEDLEIELSIMVAEEPTVWCFDRIGPRARGLLDQAETAVERGRARALVSKVARFEEIKQRSDSVNRIWHETERRNEQLAELSRRRTEGIRLSVDERFDGVGRLSRLPSTTAGTPHFALMGPNGQVQCYVTPAPGVNLQSYVGREVGIHGVRGFMPEQQAQHLVAKHVTPIDETRLR